LIFNEQSEYIFNVIYRSDEMKISFHFIRTINYKDRHRALKLFLIIYYVCLIRNKKNFNKIYLGYTDYLKRRLRERRNKNPEIIYYEAYKYKEDTQEREKKLKQRG